MQNSLMQPGLQGGMPMHNAMAMGNAMPAGMQAAMSGQSQPPQQQQQQNPNADGPCLRFPDPLPVHAQLMPPTAAEMLLSAIQLSAQKPYVWGHIDKPADGQIFLIYLSGVMNFPRDGIRFLENETRFTVPIPPNRELEVTESRLGFVPNSGETTASRVRRRFRMIKGGHPQLVLIHYGRGPTAPIPPSLMNQPVRAYPLQNHVAPPVFVVGEKAGQRVYPPGHPAAAGGMPGGMGSGGGLQGMPGVMGGMPAGMVNGMPNGMPNGLPPGLTGMGGVPLGPADQSAMLAHQNAAMGGLDRRGAPSGGTRHPGMGGMHAAQGAPPSGGVPMPTQSSMPMRVEDDEDPEEAEISTRTLAGTRYRRNHEWMNEVFMYAAFGDKVIATQPKSISSIFSKTELDDRVAKLQTELDELKTRGESRRAAQLSAEKEADAVDVSMDSFTPGVTAV